MALSMRPRPRSVALIAWIFIATGLIGFTYHANEFRAPDRVAAELIWVLVVRLVAVGAGVLMLRGSDSGRWLALVWMAYHVALSAFHSMPELVTHVAILVAIASVLLRPAATSYFRGAPALVSHDSTHR